MMDHSTFPPDQRHAATLLQPGCGVEVPVDFIGPHEMRGRYISVADPFAADREKWMNAVFHFYLEFPYSPDDTSSVSSAQNDFDVLIIGSNDPKRLLPFYRKNRAILRRKLVICLMKGSTPQRRAKAIYGGYDDAIDIDKVMPLEAVARIRAMWLRYCQQIAREEEATKEDAGLAKYCLVSRLTPKERSVMAVLAEKPGGIVPLLRLQQAASSGHSLISDANLKVTISLLRRKLKPGVRIVCESGVGYGLVLDPVAERPPRAPAT